ncbi:MAG TPA: limonene-1,2-epoxide hydrolase family protein [Candidatus Binatus sp.]|uniref:limonene-1,2-epoxide hydrolase family protein n=1 Tax=Candidatus Binatus sp. TaxID=2811406 RepID=UPI002B46C0DE|nr:limonene-1,2-epoxide hydrolase family protein [Candidatus Binatus sp.]HKN13681.1 limonene-1,2-epoxide hydrolase family protein [Candidatus Binatus sp.]
MATDAEKVVTEFCNAWPRKNVDELLGFFTDDAVYHNIPVEPAKGKEAIRGVINMFLPMAKSVQFKVLKSASAGNVVFNERVDIFDLGNGKTISLPVAGVFEVTGTKISAWRDYFDMAMYTKQMS